MTVPARKLRFIVLISLVVATLEPVSAGWLIPDAKDPVKRRILFQTRRAY